MSDLLAFRQYLAEQIAAHPNTHLHDFQAERSLICDLDRYSDAGHFDPDANRMMVDKMRSRQNLAPVEIVNTNNKLIQELVSNTCAGAIEVH